MDFLKNYLYIIVGVLLVIILIILYFMSNELKKNKNKINILESDLQALRERCQNMCVKSSDSCSIPQMPNPSDIQHILNILPIRYTFLLLIFNRC